MVRSIRVMCICRFVCCGNSSTQFQLLTFFSVIDDWLPARVKQLLPSIGILPAVRKHVKLLILRLQPDPVPVIGLQQVTTDHGYSHKDTNNMICAAHHVDSVLVRVGAEVSNICKVLKDLNT